MFICVCENIKLEQNINFIYLSIYFSIYLSIYWPICVSACITLVRNQYK